MYVLLLLDSGYKWARVRFVGCANLGAIPSAKSINFPCTVMPTIGGTLLVRRENGRGVPGNFRTQYRQSYKPVAQEISGMSGIQRTLAEY